MILKNSKIYKNLVIILIMIMSLNLSGCFGSKNGSDDGQKVTLNSYSLILAAGDTFLLTASYSGTDNTGFTWKSENETVATVVDGTVTAIAEGSTNIVVTASDGISKAVCKIEVSHNSVFNNSDLNYVFDLNALPEVRIDITVDQWNALLTNFDANPKNETEVKAAFKFNKNGVVDSLDEIGIRLRGNTSRKRPEGNNGEMHNSSNPDWHHAHFALKLDKYVKTNKFRGLKAINMKFFKDDVNYVREVYSYDLFRRFKVWTAPFSSYAKLTINVIGDNTPAYFGIYEMIEPVDSEYLVKRFPTDNGGNLWKCLYQQDGPADLKNNNFMSKMGLEDADTGYYPSYDLKTNKKSLDSAKTQFNTFVNELNSLSDSEFMAWVEGRIDVDLLLRATAVNVAVGMWDDYWINGNNYYFYFDSKGKSYFIPYDYDNALGTSSIVNDSGTQNPLEWGSSNDRPLINRILKIEKYKTLYKNYLMQLVADNSNLFDYSSSVNRITQWHNLINSGVINDTGDDNYISDNPASWSNKQNYRLMSSDETNNFFKVRKRTIETSCK